MFFSVLRRDGEAVFRQEAAQNTSVASGHSGVVEVEDVVDNAEDAETVLCTGNVIYCLHHYCKCEMREKVRQNRREHGRREERGPSKISGAER